MKCPTCQTDLPPQANFCFNCGRPVDATPHAALPGERRVVTIMFADISGFTAMSETMDPEQVRALMNACFDALVPIVEKYGGVVDKFIGDEIMALFGAPVAHEDDPVRALHVSLEMMDALTAFNAEHGTNLGMHAGINTGLVVAGGIGSRGRQQYSVMGDAVNLAARLESASERGELLVGPDTYRMAAPLFEFKALPPMQVKGKAEPVQVYRLKSLNTNPGRVRGVAGLESPMVGRRAEWAALREAGHALQRGVGRVVLVIGEPGLGKSRLIAEWRATTLQMPIATGQCLSYGQGQAYHLLIDLLHALIGLSPAAEEPETRATLRALCTDIFGQSARDVYPYLGHLLSVRLEDDALDSVQNIDPPTLQAHYLSALRRLLKKLAERNPLGLILEDIHWADPSSSGLLAQLLPLAAEAPILFAIVTRPDRDAPGWTLIDVARQRFGPDLTEIVLRTLSDDDSGQLITNLLEIEALPEPVRRLILKRAEGNPFFVEEVIRMLIDRQTIVRRDGRWVAQTDIDTVKIPDSLQRLLLARIDRLPEQARHILRVASVIGRQFSVRVLDEVLQRFMTIIPHLTDLENAGLVRLVQTRPELEYLFQHALVQEAAYESLLLADRKQLHGQVAKILERLYPDRLASRELAPVLAHHFELAGNAERACAYFTRAGDVAARLFANTEAVAHYTRALALADPNDHSTAAKLCRVRGQVYAILGDFDRAQVDHRTALKHARSGANRLDEWQAMIDLGFLWASRDYTETGRYFQQALDLARHLSNDVNLAHSLNWMGNWHLNVEEPLQARQYHQEALAIFQRLDDERGLAETFDLLGMTNLLGNDALRSRNNYHQAIEAFRRLKDRPHLSSGLATLALCAPTLQSNLMVPAISLAEGVQQARHALQIARDIGWRAGEAYALGVLGYALGAQGEYASALDMARAGLGVAEEIEHHQWMALAHCALGNLHLDMGDAPVAKHHLKQALAQANEVDSGHWRHTAVGGLAQAYLAQGNVARAEALLKTVSLPDAPNQTLGQRKCCAAWAELALARQTPQSALDIIEPMVTAIIDLNPAGCAPHLWTLRGRALAALGYLDEAEAGLRDALAEAIAQKTPAVAGRVHLALADVYQRQGRPEAARRARSAAEAITPTRMR